MRTCSCTELCLLPIILSSGCHCSILRKVAEHFKHKAFLLRWSTHWCSTATYAFTLEVHSQGIVPHSTPHATRIGAKMEVLSSLGQVCTLFYTLFTLFYTLRQCFSTLVPLSCMDFDSQDPQTCLRQKHSLKEFISQALLLIVRMINILQ